MSLNRGFRTRRGGSGDLGTLIVFTTPSTAGRSPWGGHTASPARKERTFCSPRPQPQRSRPKDGRGPLLPCSPTSHAWAPPTTQGQAGQVRQQPGHPGSGPADTGLRSCEVRGLQQLGCLWAFQLLPQTLHSPRTGPLGPPPRAPPSPRAGRPALRSDTSRGPGGGST